MFAFNYVVTLSALRAARDLALENVIVVDPDNYTEHRWIGRNTPVGER